MGKVDRKEVLLGDLYINNYTSISGGSSMSTPLYYDVVYTYCRGALQGVVGKAMMQAYAYPLFRIVL